MLFYFCAISWFVLGFLSTALTMAFLIQEHDIENAEIHDGLAMIASIIVGTTFGLLTVFYCLYTIEKYDNPFISKNMMKFFYWLGTKLYGKNH